MFLTKPLKNFHIWIFFKLDSSNTILSIISSYIVVVTIWHQEILFRTQRPPELDKPATFLYFGHILWVLNDVHTFSMECCLHSTANCLMRIAARQPHPDGSRLIQFVSPSAVATVQPLGKFPAGCPPLILWAC